MGDFLMFDDKGPLLFINSVTTEAIPKNQTTFDSRDTSNRKLAFKDTKKLHNLIEMYQKKRPVLCNLLTENKNYIGIPYHLENNFLLFKTQDGQDEKLDLALLRKIEIIRF
jgi:histidinol-phosphate/aromatic aminotransferase/cobyric acid decarboxylase-like protein